MSETLKPNKRKLNETAGAQPGVLPALQRRSAETRDRILDAGERVFARSGYEGARLADVAAEAGCSVGSIYARFEDKDGLFKAIQARFCADARGSMDGVAELLAPLSTKEATLAIIRASVANFREHQGLFRASLERSFQDPDVWTPIRDLHDRVAQGFASLAGWRRSDYGHPDLETAMPFIVQMVHASLLHAAVQGAPRYALDDPAFVEELERTVLSYLQISDG